MQRNAAPVGDVPDCPRVFGCQWLTHRVGMRVLEGDQTRDRLVDVTRLAKCRLDCAEIDRPVRILRQGTDARPDDDRVRRRLVHDDMAGGRGDRLLAAGEVGHLGDEVAHRPGRDEQPSFLAEELGRPFLERVDGRIVVEHVVADLGRGHRRRISSVGFVTVSDRRSMTDIDGEYR